jgi:hypothetical protein
MLQKDINKYNNTHARAEAEACVALMQYNTHWRKKKKKQSIKGCIKFNGCAPVKDKLESL